MSYSGGPFDTKRALLVQAQQLKDWEKRLNPTCYAALMVEVAAQNSRHHHSIIGSMSNGGYAVFRGTQIDTFVAGWKPTATHATEANIPDTPTV